MLSVRGLLVVAITVGLIACAPRGESKSLNEVVAIAKNRFALVQEVPVDAAVKESLKPVVKALEDIVNNPRGGGVTKNSKVIAVALSELSMRTSYTNRPALGELLSQYLVMSTTPASEVNGASVKLLAARTYSLLASELETRRFTL